MPRFKRNTSQVRVLVFTSGVTLVKPGVKVVPCNVGSVRFLAFADCNAN